MTTIKIRREELTGHIDHLSGLLGAKGDESIKAVLAAVAAYAEPNGVACDDAYDSLVKLESALRSVLGGIESLATIRAGESGGFINGINLSAGTCRIAADTDSGFAIIAVADYEPQYDTLFIEVEV